MPQYGLAFRLLGGCGLCWKLASSGRSPRSNDFQVTFGLDSTLRRRAHYLVIQDANHHGHVDYRSRVHRPVYQFKGGNPFNGTAKEAREHGLCIDELPPRVHCTVFEDNSGALELARLPKIRPRTKHINQAYHHFREHVERREI